MKDQEKILKLIKNLKIRCSSISKVSAYLAKNELPVGAKTYIEELVDQIVYKFDEDINSKYFEKGHIMEDDSIVIYNSVFFTNYVKAEKPSSNDYLTTESCDIDDEKLDKIIDIKTSWSKKTFPKTKKNAYADAKKAGYPLQIQGYMSIFKRKKAEIAFCLVDTPEGLCQYENQTMHVMDDVDDQFRVTRIQYDHDPVLEAQIYARVELCRIYAVEYFNEIIADHV